MRASKLRHRIDIQRPATGEDDNGQQLTGWVHFKDVWANIEMQSARETIRAGAITMTANGVIELRYCTDIDSSMRAVHGGVVYNFKGVRQDLERKERTELIVEAVQ